MGATIYSFIGLIIGGIFSFLMQQNVLKWRPNPVWNAELSTCWETTGLPCAQRWARRNSSFESVLSTMSIEVDPHSSRFQFVEYDLPGRIRLKGLLALRPGGKPAPLAVIRAGLFSNSTEFLPERFLLLQYFEQMPFHVLLLESSSGSEFVQRNSRLMFGGFDEGRQNEQLAQLLSKQKEFSSLHLVGVSLGGHGVLAAGMNEKTPYKSITAFCPLVDLPATLHHHTDHWVRRSLLNFWIPVRLSGLPAIGVDVSESPIAGLLQYLQQKADGQYWSQNQWHQNLRLQRPTLVLSTRKDDLVPYALNTGKYLVDQPNVRLLTLESGTHCSLPGSYHWNAFVPLMESHILQAAGLTKTMQSEPFAGPVRDYKLEIRPSGVVNLVYKRFRVWPQRQEIHPQLPFSVDSFENRLANARWLSAQLRFRDGKLHWPVVADP